MGIVNPQPRITTKPHAHTSRHSVALSDWIFDVRTTAPIEFIDLTEVINQHLAGQEVETGLVTVFSRHTTAAIKINEAEELLLEDFRRMLERICPPHRRYEHNDMSRRKPPIAPDERPNAHSHLMHLLLSTSEHIPVAGGRLAFGTWQRVFLVELDGPREREVMVRCASYHPHERAAALVLHAHNGIGAAPAPRHAARPK
jgi:secondary thiamine-phosphate synthase enzyme